MTSSFGLSGKNLINFSRGLLILFLMQFHLLSLTPCHIARRQSTNKTLFKTIEAKNDFQFLVLYTFVFFGNFSHHDSDTTLKKYFMIST